MALSNEQLKVIAIARARKRQAESQAAPVEPVEPEKTIEDFQKSSLDELIGLGIDPQVAQRESIRLGAERKMAEQAPGVLRGGAGAAPTILSGMIATPVAGLSGIAQSLNPFADKGAGAKAVSGVQKALTIDPIGEEAKEGLAEFGEFIEPVATAPRKAGEFSQETLGFSPGAATAVETGITAIPEMLGLKGFRSVSAAKRVAKANKPLFDQKTGLPSPELEKALQKREMDFGALIGDGDNVPTVFGNKSASQTVDEIIKRKIQSGDQSEALYKFKLSNDGKVISDPLGDAALKQGFRKGDIASAKSANRLTKREMIDMLRMKRQIQSDQSKALDFRPSDVIGKNAVERFDFIKNRTSTLRKELDSMANTRMPSGKNLLESSNAGGSLVGRKINTDKVTGEFFDSLDSLEIDIDANSIPPKMDYKKSLISEDKTSQGVIDSISRILSKDKPMDAAEAHKIKRQIDTMLDFNKKSAAGLTDAGKDFAKGVRRSINDSIREVSPRYARVNDELSASITALDDFDKALGGSVDVFSKSASKSVGQTLRRLMSNAATRTNLDDALSNLSTLSEKFGGVFDVDLKRLVLFNKTLDDQFGATARTSLAGEVESAVRGGPSQAAKDVVIKKVAEKVEGLRGIDEASAFNIMEKILRQSSGATQ